LGQGLANRLRYQSVLSGLAERKLFLDIWEREDEQAMGALLPMR
jgi:hypothetical protein